MRCNVVFDHVNAYPVSAAASKPLTVDHARRSLFSLAGLLAMQPGYCLAVPTDNLEIVAVPTPGKVVIDGKLDDWDLSGTILSCANAPAFLKTATASASAT